MEINKNTKIEIAIFVAILVILLLFLTVEFKTHQQPIKQKVVDELHQT